MKNTLLFFIVFLCSRTPSWSQAVYGKGLVFVDSSKTALEFIADEFYNTAHRLDTCCLYAFGSAKFTIASNDKIGSVKISAGIPKNIAIHLEAAIQSTLYHWKINGNYRHISIIIPVFIAPSNSCKKENYKDDILSSAAAMFNYEDSYKNVRRNNYYKIAKKVESGIIFPLLLIKDPFNDRY